jgi:peptidoglycan-associated lipoprotein
MRHLLASLALLAVGSVGCAHPATVVPTPPPTVPGGASSPASPTAGGDSAAAAPTGAARADCGVVRVHFPFDSSTVVPEDRSLLDEAGSCLRRQQGLRVVIEGNADERGTVEYNIALGQRRADAVRTYLEELGVSSAQVRTVSYGEERPLCTEHSEDCWAKNRRAALVPPSRG